MTRTSATPSLTFAILTGGEGARFGGHDKGLLTLNGQPLIERMLQQLEPHGHPLMISANRHADVYAQYGHRVVPDERTGFNGPLAGISAVLNQAQTEWVLFVPVDAVKLPTDFILSMCAALSDQPAVAHDGSSIIPVACCIPSRLRNDLSLTLETEKFSVRKWLHKHRAIEIHFDDHPRAYWSVNTPEELAALESKLMESN
jgi:molybdopterin-guanine dinucleotide biosynthesis protein A